MLGNWDTAHIIRGPEGLSKLVGLQNRPCTAERAALRLSSSDCVKLRNQVPGWRLQDDADTKEANVLLVRSWNVRDAAAGAELAKRAAALARERGARPFQNVRRGGLGDRDRRGDAADGGAQGAD